LLTLVIDFFDYIIIEFRKWNARNRYKNRYNLSMERENKKVKYMIIKMILNILKILYCGFEVRDGHQRLKPLSYQ